LESDWFGLDQCGANIGLGASELDVLGLNAVGLKVVGLNAIGLDVPGFKLTWMGWD